jgi:hypothetical protein
MIQRIQTIYLALATLLQGLLFVFPFANAEKTSEGAFIDGDLDLFDNAGLMSTDVAALALTLLCIFMFNNRKMQLNLTFIGMVLSVALIGIAAFFAFGTGVAASLGIGLFLPPIAAVMYYLAYKGIKSDDELVKSSNRLR